MKTDPAKANTQEIQDGTTTTYDESGAIKQIDYPDGMSGHYKNGVIHSGVEKDPIAMITRYYADGQLHLEQSVFGSRYFEDGQFHSMVKPEPTALEQLTEKANQKAQSLFSSFKRMIGSEEKTEPANKIKPN